MEEQKSCTNCACRPVCEVYIYANDPCVHWKPDVVNCGECRFAIDETVDGWMWCNNWNCSTVCGGYCHAGERKTDAAQN